MKNKNVDSKQLFKSSIDWNEILKKVEQAEKYLMNSSVLSKEEQLPILKKRAHELSIEQIETTTGQELIEIIEFSLGYERYGLETSFIREVYPLKDFTPLPGTPAFLLGIINVRGQIISVIDLKKFFNIPEKGLGELNKVIIIKNERMEFGILADTIEGTYSIPLETVKSSPFTGDFIVTEYIKGVTREHLIVLDAEIILNDEKIIVNK